MYIEKGASSFDTPCRTYESDDSFSDPSSAVKPDGSFPLLSRQYVWILSQIFKALDANPTTRQIKSSNCILLPLYILHNGGIHRGMHELLGNKLPSIRG